MNDRLKEFELMKEQLISLHLMPLASMDPSAIDAVVPDGETEASMYKMRNAQIYLCLGYATMAGWTCGMRGDSGNAWPVAFIDIPGHGQVSWHMPGYPAPYDGHTTAEKYGRIARYVDEVDERVEAQRSAQALADLRGKRSTVVYVGGDEDKATVNQAWAEPTYGPGTEEPIPVPVGERTPEMVERLRNFLNEAEQAAPLADPGE